MKEIKTAAKRQVRNEEDSFTFPVQETDIQIVDGQEVEVVTHTQQCVTNRPTEGQLVFLLAAEASETRSTESRMAGMVDFALAIFDEPTRRYFGGRLLDPEDGFGFSDFMDIVQAVVEEWSNRPTKLSSDSTSSPASTGDSSTDGSQPKALASSTSG